MKWIAGSLLLLFFVLIWLSLGREKVPAHTSSVIRPLVARPEEDAKVGPNSTPTLEQVEILKGEAHYKRVLAIQIAADKTHGKFVSEEHSQKLFQKACDHFTPLRGQHVFYCELMLTNYEIGEALSELLARHRYAKESQTKLQVHLKIMEIYAKLRKLETTDRFLNCDNGNVFFENQLMGERFELAFDGVGADENFGTHSFDSQEHHEALASYKDHLAKEAKLRRRSLFGVMAITNADKGEIQICPYNQAQ